MADIIRESPVGQVIRFATRNKYLRYPEEIAGFQIPWEGVFSPSVAKKLTESSDGSHHEPDEKDDGREVEKDLEADELARKMTTRGTLGTSIGPTSTISRTATREQTLPYSVERFQTGIEEEADRRQSVVIVPRKTSDGIILVDWYTTDERVEALISYPNTGNADLSSSPANPQNWGSRKKAYVGLQIFIYTFAVYCGSAIYTSSEPQIMRAFNVGQAKASLGLSMYVIGYGVGPLIFSPLSEIPVVGRNVPYMVSFALFVILCVPMALVNNYAGLLVLRFLTGFMGSPCLATGAATMQDMYSFMKLPYALTAWVAAAFCAPALGPVLSGFSVVAKGWRWSLWETLWMAGPVFVLMFLTFPETSASNILLRRAHRLRKMTANPMLKSQSELDQGEKTIGKVVYDSLLIPMKICLQDPAVLFTNLYTSLIYGIYYSYFEAFPLVYIGDYGFNLGEQGVVFTCIVVGTVIGIAVYCSYIWFYLEPDIMKHGLRAQEHRLVPALFAVVLLPAGLFLFAWTARPSVHWIVSVIGITMFATGAFVLLQCVFMYLPLSYPQYAASLFAANDASRSALAAGSIIYARPLFVNLGIGRGVSILGGLAAGGCLGIWAIYYYGAILRARSKFAQA